MKILITLVAATLFAVLGGLAYIYSGRFDIGADAPHSAAVLNLLSLVRERAIAVRVKHLDVPALDDPQRIAAGASEYAEMCAGCHLAPGVANNELRPGLYPPPPALARREIQAGTGDATTEAARQFWIVKHGIKMSSMPAWGVTHDDDTLWNIVAFLRKLPDLTPEQYAAMTADAESEHEMTGHGDHASEADHTQHAHHH